MISGYVTNKYNEIPDIRLIMLKLENLTLAPPANPLGGSRSVLQIHEKEIDLHVNRKRQLEVNIGKLYALVIGQ